MYINKKIYTVRSAKISNPFRCVLISDLHNRDHGHGNSRILSELRALQPDFILCAGDLIVGRSDKPQDKALAFAKALPDIAPVYFSNGNHETQLRVYDPKRYEEYICFLQDNGIRVLNNCSEEIFVRGNRIIIHGLELGLSKFHKFAVQHISERYIRERIGYVEDKEAYHILIAHNPEFGDLYCRCGVDLIAAGHYHGGVIRSPFSGRNMLSPYGFYYPKHGYGQIVWKDTGEYFRNTSDRHPAGDNVPCGTCMITSAGLGDHKPLIRIFNPFELVAIDIKEN